MEDNINIELYDITKQTTTDDENSDPSEEEYDLDEDLGDIENGILDDQDDEDEEYDDDT